MNWFYSRSSTKSISELQSFVDVVILAPNFKNLDLLGFSVKRELRQLDRGTNSKTSTSPPLTKMGGSNHQIYIKLPCKKVNQEEDTAPTLEVPGVYTEV